MKLLEFNEVNTYVYNLEEIPLLILDEYLTKDENILIYITFLTHHASNSFNNDLDEIVNYFKQLIEQCNTHFELNLSDVEKDICIAYMSSRKHGRTTKTFVDKFEYLLNEVVDKNSILWPMYQDVLYTLVNMISQVDFNAERIRAIISILKENKDEFEIKIQRYHAIFTRYLKG